VIEFAIDVISVLPVLSTVGSPAIKDAAPERKMKAVVDEVVDPKVGRSLQRGSELEPYFVETVKRLTATPKRFRKIAT
jgi:hypothetical protein